jgi:ERF superfamily
MMTTSPTTDALDTALAKAQGEITVAVKDKINPHFKSKYADLASVAEVCRAVLPKHGISVTQWPVHSEDGRLHMVTRLAHAGQWLQAEFSVPVQKQDAQGYGSAITYLRRFALAAATGVVADEDDDGNAAVTKPASKAASRDTYTALQDSLWACQTREAILKWAAVHGPTIDALPDDWRETLRKDTKAHLKQVEQLEPPEGA